MTPATAAPPAFHLMTKPTGAVCNLDCKYCFFLSKEKLYPGSRFRMTDEVLEAYIRQLVEAHHRVPEIVIAWQGGEPTLMGVDFFRRAAELANRFKKPDQTIHYAFQTNGILLNDAWGAFFREHHVLVGISIDGPRELHDAYRVDKGGRPTHVRVLRGLDVLKRHGVGWNVLCTLHRANADHPLEVYRFLRDDLGAGFIQFIPIVERDNDTGFQEGDTVTDRSVGSAQYGRFLNAVFDEWVRRDVGRVFVQSFDVALGQWVGAPPTLCVHSPTCGGALALEHNGDLYSCDHFVEPGHLLGNVMEQEMGELVASPRQRKFGRDKLENLPRYCRECEVRFACHGGCPKDRFIETPDGEPGLNYLCAGYRAFFNHIDPTMRLMASLVRQGRRAEEVMGILGEEPTGPKPRRPSATRGAAPGRNDPCPCGSGQKYKRCHGRRAA